MRFSRYFFLLLACLAASTFLLPRLYHLPFPSQPGPAFDDKTRPSLVKILQKNDIQLALIGDSVLQEGVDPQALSAALEVPAHSIAVPGSTSPFWYLILKNVILETVPPPRVVVVLFRDTILTLPNYHVNGGYVNELDQWAAAREDLLVQRAYLNFMNPLEKWALTWLPLYGARQRLTDAADFVSRNALPYLFQTCRGDCLAQAETDIFHIDNVQPSLQQRALVEEEQFLYTPAAMDFDYWVDRSFLPEMIRLAREGGVRLVFVHERTLLFPSAVAEPEALRAYKAKLADYLRANDVSLLDFSYDPRLPASGFNDALHMNAAGKAAFTQLLAEALRPLLSK